MLTVSKQGQIGKEEGRPSRWKDGLTARLCIIQPITSESREVEDWLEAPWGHWLEVLGRFLRRAPETVRMERRLRRPLRAHQRTNPGHG